MIDESIQIRIQERVAVSQLPFGCIFSLPAYAHGSFVEGRTMASECSIQEFIRQLRSLSRPQFTLEGVHEFLKSHPIDPNSLKNISFSESRTTHATSLTNPTFTKCSRFVGKRDKKARSTTIVVRIVGWPFRMGSCLVQNYRVVEGSGRHRTL